MVTSAEPIPLFPSEDILGLSDPHFIAKGERYKRDIYLDGYRDGVRHARRDEMPNLPFLWTVCWGAEERIGEPYPYWKLGFLAGWAEQMTEWG